MTATEDDFDRLLDEILKENEEVFRRLAEISKNHEDHQAQESPQNEPGE